jgi:hypothetical protein
MADGGLSLSHVPEAGTWGTHGRGDRCIKKKSGSFDFAQDDNLEKCAEEFIIPRFVLSHSCEKKHRKMHRG